MKKVSFITSPLFFSSLISCTQEETTTYYLIRHAEKDRTDKN